MVGTVIKSLVSQGKRVIIPDFGAFLIKDSTLSNILTKDNVTFSPFLKYNDGFLENELAHVCGLHKDDARLKVASFVDAVKNSISNVDKKVYEVEGLGYFYKDRQGNAAFSIDRPYEESRDMEENELATTMVNNSTVKEEELVGKPVDVFTESIPNVIFSSSKVDMDNPLADKDQQHIVDKTKENNENTDVKSKDKEDDVSVGVLNNKGEIIKREEEIHRSNSTPRKISKPLLVGFILLVGALFVLNVFWTDIFGTKADISKPKIVLDPIDSEQKEVEEKKLEAEEVAQDAIDNEVVATVENTVKNTASLSKREGERDANVKEETKENERLNVNKKALVTGAKKPVKQESSIDSKSFVVVLGSFETNENAEKHVAHLAKKKIKGRVVHRSKVYSVVTSSFKTYEEAQKEKDRIKVLGVDGWISSK